MVEIIKRYAALGKEPQVSYWRDSNMKEIDFIIEKGGRPQYAIEVKSTTTYRPRAFQNLEDIAPLIGVDPEHRYLVYGGDETFETKHGTVLSFTNLGRLVE
ncbi:ATPase [Bifidobacterium thermophilum RBL67]|uniref:ATPase n=1 Tax=Bifidobacterium thermophilum RBL67 TaxID=1254439 RepID=M4RDK6_9BIFI|nr:ATPase [Bifidobacterium thermophilum RBL67]